MDAIVTIQIFDGKKAVSSTETAIEIHPTIATDIAGCPDTAAAWILSQARERMRDTGVEFSPVKARGASSAGASSAGSRSNAEAE